MRAVGQKILNRREIVCKGQIQGMKKETYKETYNFPHAKLHA